MALPRKLKNFNVFKDGINFLGIVPELTLPKLSRKMEEFRAGGMDGPVDSDMGGELLTLDYTTGGIVKSALEDFGATSATASALRFAGAYQRDDTGDTDAVEVVVLGRPKEIDMGTAKPGEDTQHKFTMTCSYYRLSINGVVIIEIDRLNFIFNVGGVDRLAEQRRAMGL